jgi:hypothetical protein
VLSTLLLVTMKLLLPALLLVASASAADISVFLQNPLDDLVKGLLEYVRKQMKDKEPFPVPDLPPQQVKGDGVDMTVKFSNLRVSKASDFTIDHIENNLFGMWAKFGVTVPQMHIDGNFDANGQVKGTAVTGTGTFTLDISQLVTNGYVKLSMDTGSVQITQLDLDYNVQNVKFSQKGLVIEGMTEQQINDLINTSMTIFVNDKPFVTSNVSAYVMKVANDMMRGKTIQQLIDWIKQFINGQNIN